MTPPRVLIVLDAASAWSRGVLMGFAGVANQRNWTVLHYHPTSELSWLLKEWNPRVVVLPPWQRRVSGDTASNRIRITVNGDRSADGIASVCLDEAKIGEFAATHLLATGITNFAVFRFDESPFAITRERHFSAQVLANGAKVVPGWGHTDPAPSDRGEDAAKLIRWLQSLPKPCGVFACTDSWARVVARYCQIAQIKIPEQIALVGVDNDVIDCEFATPPMSSVAIPWRQMGASVAELVGRALCGKAITGKRIVIEPQDVVVRRSSDILAVSDDLVKKAIEWIVSHAERRLTVPEVAKATRVTRQTLERRFRAVLGRTVMQEVRRAHVQVARRLLATTDLELLQVARLSGFSSAALLHVAFVRELGLPPGAYRRQAQNLFRDGD